MSGKRGGCDLVGHADVLKVQAVLTTLVARRLTSGLELRGLDGAWQESHSAQIFNSMGACVIWTETEGVLAAKLSQADMGVCTKPGQQQQRN
jgi:hypothetical protein